MAERQTQLTADQLYPGSIPGLGFLGIKVKKRRTKGRGEKNMKRKNIVGLIALVAIVAAVIFAGCVEEETPVPTPSPTAIPLPKTTPTPEAPTATPSLEPTATPTSTPTLTPSPTPTAIPFERIEGLTTIRVGGGIWDNWDADMENDGPVIDIVYLDAKGDIITDKSTKKMPISADVKVYAGESSIAPKTKLVFSGHYAGDQIIYGILGPEFRIPKEEISVNPSVDYWCGAIEVTIYTPKQGSFSDRDDFIELYEEH